MTFSEFAATLIAAYIRYPFMEDEIRAAGIDLAKVPDTLLAKPIYTEYAKRLTSAPREVAQAEVEIHLESLERLGIAAGFSEIPRDAVVLRHKYQELYSAFQFEQLADQLRKKPEQGAELIKSFELEKAKGVESATLAELSVLIGHQHEAAKEKRSVQTIKRFEQLSHMIGGFNPERLGIFLGGTGFGKTNFAINLAIAAAETMTVAYVNMEMGFTDMVKRFTVIGTQTSYLKYATGDFDPEDLKAQVSKHGDNIHLTSGRTLTFRQIESWLRLLSQKTKLGLIVIDYDQKVDLELKHQAEEWKALQKVMEAFEDLAKELSTYVLILAQVNREGLISGSHRAQFPAHAVLAFYEHETFGAVVEAKKNRHGKKNQALKVIYDEQTSAIFEQDVITLDKKQKEKRHEIPKAPQAKRWEGYT